MMSLFLGGRSARRRAALKFLPDELVSDPLALQRFESEVQTGPSLKHAGAICHLRFTHTLWRLVSRCCEADFLSRFRRFPPKIRFWSSRKKKLAPSARVPV